MFRRCERNTRGSRKEECPVHNGSAPPQLISLEKGMELCAPPLFLELCQVFCTALLQKIRLKASNDLKNGANTSNTRFQRTRVQDLIIVFFDTDCKAFQSSSKKPESVIYSDAFPMPSQHTHHAFQDSLAFKGKLCRCHLAWLGLGRTTVHWVAIRNTFFWLSGRPHCDLQPSGAVEGRHCMFWN